MQMDLSSVPFAAITLDHQGLLVDANETFSSWFEASDGLFHKPFESYLSPASRLMFHSLFFPQVQMNGIIDELYITLKTDMISSLPVLLMGSVQEDDTIACVLIRTAKRDNYEGELQAIKQKLEEAYGTETRLRKLFETTLFAIHEGLVVTNPQGEIRIINSFAQSYARECESIQGRPFSDIFYLFKDKAKTVRMDIFETLMESGDESLSFDELILDGKELRYVSGSISLILEDGESVGTVISLHDVTETYRQEREIDTFLNINMEILCVLNSKGEFYKVNQRLLNAFGYTEADLIGVSYLQYVHDDDKERTIEHWFETRDLDSAVITNRYMHKDGTYRIVEWHRQKTVGNYVYSVGRDITDDIMREAALNQEANYDALTGLHNRSYLMRHIEGIMNHAADQNNPLTLAIMDLDFFKSVNDTWGHPVGDSLLSHVASILNANTRDSDVLVRFGGEEFILVFINTESEDAHTILERIRENIMAQKHDIAVNQTLSIGYTQWDTEESFMSLYSRADQALYEAKEQGRNRSIYL